VGAIAFLSAMGRSFPFVPPILLPVLAFDLAADRGQAAPIRAAGLSAAVYATYVPYLNIVLTGFRLGVGDVVVGDHCRCRGEIVLPPAIAGRALAALALGEPVGEPGAGSVAHLISPRADSI
jgi:hypothetical protein